MTGCASRVLIACCLTSLVSTPLARAEKSESIFEINAAVLCNNLDTRERTNYTKYVIISGRVGGISKLTDLDYFQDGYPNIIGSNFTSADSVVMGETSATVEMSLVGSPVAPGSLKKSQGARSRCEVSLPPGWKAKARTNHGTLQVKEFELKCEFVAPSKEICTNKDIKLPIYMTLSTSGKKLPLMHLLTLRD